MKVQWKECHARFAMLRVGKGPDGLMTTLPMWLYNLLPNGKLSGETSM